MLTPRIPASSGFHPLPRSDMFRSNPRLDLAAYAAFRGSPKKSKFLSKFAPASPFPQDTQARFHFGLLTGPDIHDKGDGGHVGVRLAWQDGDLLARTQF